MARTGLGLYKNVVSLKTKLVSARRMPAGHSIGYERTCVLEKDTLVGTIAAGYADGLPLALSNRGRVLYQGKSCPILGRISMDYTTIALDPDTKWQKGDTVTLVGQDGAEQIAMDEWADLKQTHVYQPPRQTGILLITFRNISTRSRSTRAVFRSGGSAPDHAPELLPFQWDPSSGSRSLRTRGGRC